MTKQKSTKRFLQYFSFAVITVALSTVLLPTLGQAALGKNTIVAAVFDEPIRKVELRFDPETGGAVADVRMRILRPVLLQYRQAFQRVFEPRHYEMMAALSYLQELHESYLEAESVTISERLALIEAQLEQADLPERSKAHLLRSRDELLESLEPPSEDQVWALVAYWKFQRHLYDVYGGGRVVIQDYGPEAIDATINWLELREDEGDFTILDARLRAAFYDTWARLAYDDGVGAEASESLESLSIQGQADTGGERLAPHTGAKELHYDQNRQHLLNPSWMPKPPQGAPSANVEAVGATMDRTSLE